MPTYTFQNQPNPLEIRNKKTNKTDKHRLLLINKIKIDKVKHFPLQTKKVNKKLTLI